MSSFDPLLTFYVVVFLGTMLLLQSAYNYVSARNSAVNRVNQRMRLLAAGSSNDDVLAALRRDAPQARSLFAPPRLVEYLEVRLTQAGLKLPAHRLVMLMLIVTLTIGILLPLVGNFAGKLHSLAGFLLLGVFGVGVGVVLPLIILARKADKRMAKFESQFPVALDIFVRGLRAGHPVTSALELLVSEIPDPIGSEFGIVVAEMNYGSDLRGALTNLAARVRTQDIQMFVVSVAIQSETGGSLADILDGLSKVIRERASMALKVRALASEGRMTGTVLSVLPLVTFCFVFATQPSFYLNVINDPLFLPGITAVGIWYAIGITIMKKLIKIKV